MCSYICRKNSLHSKGFDNFLRENDRDEKEYCVSISYLLVTMSLIMLVAITIVESDIFKTDLAYMRKRRSSNKHHKKKKKKRRRPSNLNTLSTLCVRKTSPFNGNAGKLEILKHFSRQKLKVPNLLSGL